MGAIDLPAVCYRRGSAGGENPAASTPTTPEIDAPTALVTVPPEEADAFVHRRGDAARILNFADAGENHDSVFAAGHVAGLLTLPLAPVRCRSRRPQSQRRRWLRK